MYQPAMKADCEPLLRPVTAFLDILDRVAERNARAVVAQITGGIVK
jgi:hypothetical protein